MKYLPLFLSLMALMTCFDVAAQDDLAAKMKKEGVVPGAIYQKGKKTEGYIKTITYQSDNGEYTSPWAYQDDFKFIEAEKFVKKEKVKNRDFEKYGPKDIDGYDYEDLTFVSAKYSDMTAVGTNMIARTRFFRKIKDGKVNIYHYYSAPPPVTTGDYDYTPHLTPQPVYRIGEKGKLTLVANMKVEKELKDCPEVVEQYKNGAYDVIGGNKKHKGKLAKLANKTNDLREKIHLKVIEDYNEKCK